MIRRTRTQRAVAALAVVLVICPWSDPAFAGGIIAVSGTVNQSGNVMEGATALANPPGSDETQGAIEIDLAALRALTPESSLGEASLNLVGVQFDVPKTFEIRTYGADVALTESDFNAGGIGDPVFSYLVTGPTGPDGLTFTIPLTSADFGRAAGIGFNLRESESPGNALISVEYVFVATILVLGAITGLVAVRQAAEPELGPGGIPTGNLVFGPPEVTITPIVPEPASVLLLLLGALLAFPLRRRRHGG